MKWLQICALLTLALAVYSKPTSTEHDVKEEVAGTSEGLLTEDSGKKRHVITYDQRQEGKFNVRADLENFVIVFVPSSPSQGMNLLEMLASMKRSNQAKHALHKKYSHKAHAGSEGSSLTVTKQGKEPFSARIVDHFIEGRTPYRVDLSEPILATHLNPPAEMKSTDTNSPVLRLVRPSSVAVDQPQVFISEGNASPLYYELANDNFRQKRSLTEPNSQLDSNSLMLPISKSSARSSSNGVPSSGDGELFISPISSPYLRQLTDPIPTFDSLDVEPEYVNDEWRLLGATETGCGPDMRRDSYGVCRYYPTI